MNTPIELRQSGQVPTYEKKVSVLHTQSGSPWQSCGRGVIGCGVFALARKSTARMEPDDLRSLDASDID